MGQEASCLAFSDYLKAEGFLIGSIRYPTVPKGEARLRLTVSALQTELQWDDLIDKMSVYANKMSV